MNVYLISGLGADSRAFNNLVFDKHIIIHHLNWIEPLKTETLKEYAKRLAGKIDTSTPFVIIGLSFGGMLASEMGKFLKPEKIILLSSVNNYGELPLHYRWGGRLRLHRFLPSKPMKGSFFFMTYLFGIKSKNDKALLKDVIGNTNVVFSRWAINAILTWDKSTVDTDVIRIHGDRDRVLPVTTFKPDYLIKKGGHLIVINRAEEISSVLNKLITR